MKINKLAWAALAFSSCAIVFSVCFAVVNYQTGDWCGVATNVFCCATYVFTIYNIRKSMKLSREIDAQVAELKAQVDKDWADFEERING